MIKRMSVFTLLLPGAFVYVKGLSDGKGGKETDVCALVLYDSACGLHAELD